MLSDETVNVRYMVDDLAGDVERLRNDGARFRNDIVTGPGGSQSGRAAHNGKVADDGWGVTRRQFLQGTAVSAALAAVSGVLPFGPVGAQSAGRGRRVAILGGGVAGLSAAHELVERGFDVVVYDRHGVFGGKARSIPVPGSAGGGRADLPGEHGFRFFPGFYKNLGDTLRRIPVGAGSAYNRLVRASTYLHSRAGGRADMALTLSAPPVLTVESFV